MVQVMAAARQMDGMADDLSPHRGQALTQQIAGELKALQRYVESGRDATPGTVDLRVRSIEAHIHEYRAWCRNKAAGMVV